MPPIRSTDFGLRISDFGFAGARNGHSSWGLLPTLGRGKFEFKNPRIPGIFPARGTRVFSPRGALPAPSTHHNQLRRPSITPTLRKVAAGPARRGFPRAGGRGVGAGKKEFEGVPSLKCSPPARRRRVHRRCLASRLDVVLNVMSACLASSRGIASPEHRRGLAHGNG